MKHARRRSTRLVALALAGLCAVIGAASCGYRSGFSLPEGQTIGVKVFDNQCKLRDVEMRLHPYLTDAVQRFVAADLVSPARADVWIEGVVLEYSRRGGIRSSQNVQLETGVLIAVQARLVERLRDPTDGATTRVLRELTVTDERGYLTSDPLGESNAVTAVLRNVADRLVLDLVADLAYEGAPVGELRPSR